jgi:hypothetical protein
MPNLGWMGLSSLTLGEDPLKDMGTSLCDFHWKDQNYNWKKKEEEMEE